MAVAPLAPLPLRYAWRALRRAPVFTTTVVFTLALGVGAVTAIFSIVNAVLLRPLPYAESERLVSVGHAAPGLKLGEIGQSLGTYFTYRRVATAFEEIGMYSTESVSLADPAGRAEPERARAAAITPSVLSVLKAHPLRGRGFTDAEGRPNGAPVVLLSEDFWRRRFGADPTLIGRTVQLDGKSTEVVGIMPASFGFPDYRVQAWIPRHLDPAQAMAGGFNDQGIARLRPGVTLLTAQRDAERALQRFPELYPILAPGMATKAVVENAKVRPTVRPMRETVVGQFGEILWIIAATAGVVLLVACANVANLLLVRSEARQKELTVRAALGAGRGRVLSYFLAESVVLGALGGALGVALARVGVELLVRFGPDELPRLNEISVDATSLAFGAAAAMVASLAASVFPAIRQHRTNLGAMMREGGRSGMVAKGRQQARGLLVALQVAMAVVLLAGSGVLARSILRMKDVRSGFDPKQLLTFRIDLPQATYRTSGDVVRLYDQLLVRLAALPGVRTAGLTSKLPLVPDGTNLNPVERSDRPPAPNELPPLALFLRATDTYFRTMGIPLVAGRMFGSLTSSQTPFEAIVSRRMATEVWGDSTGAAAIGKQLKMLNGSRYTVIGVVEGVRDTSLAAPPTAQMYFPIVSASDSGGDKDLLDVSSMSVVVRASVDPSTLTSAVRRVVSELDPSLPIYRLSTMDDVVGASYARLTFTLLVLAVAAGAALLLGAVGLYGVVAYVVGLRTREIGVRIALGAQPGAVGRGVARQGILLALAGAGTGLVVFAVVAQSLRAFLFQVAPSDPVTLAGVVVLLVGVAACASWVPAVRASRISPVEAMRAE